MGISEWLDGRINSKKESSGLKCHCMAGGLAPTKTLCQGPNGPLAMMFVLISGNLCPVLFCFMFGVFWGKRECVDISETGKIIYFLHLPFPELLSALLTESC